jgi:hypothetical protein
MNVEYFIIGHDVNLLDYSWNSLKHTFLKVGKYNNDRNNKNSIMCCNLKENIEDFPYLCSFTGWYALSKNKISTKEYLGIFEYDSQISNNFDNINNLVVNQHTNTPLVIGYNYTKTNHYVFTKSTPWLELSLKKIYNIDLNKFINKYNNQYPNWLTSTSFTMHKSVLDDFVEWFLPMTLVFRTFPLGAYVHERAFFIFCVLHNIDMHYVPSAVCHKQQCSHNIQDIYGRYLKDNNTTQLMESMQSGYEKIYNRALHEASMILT